MWNPTRPRHPVRAPAHSRSQKRPEGAAPRPPSTHGRGEERGHRVSGHWQTGLKQRRFGLGRRGIPTLLTVLFPTPSWMWPAGHAAENGQQVSKQWPLATAWPLSVTEKNQPSPRGTWASTRPRLCRRFCFGSRPLNSGCDPNTWVLTHRQPGLGLGHLLPSSRNAPWTRRSPRSTAYGPVRPHLPGARSPARLGGSPQRRI